jgi:AraC family transcriptional regulator
MGEAAGGAASIAPTRWEHGRPMLLAGVEVEAFDGLPHQLGRMRVPAQRYAVFTHRGHVAGVARRPSVVASGGITVPRVPTPRPPW